MQIFITKNGQQLGPYTLDQVRSQVDAGTLDATDWAWYEGLADWAPINHVPGFSTSEASSTSTRTTPPPTPVRRPALVWVISIFYFICIPFSLLSLALIPFMLSGAIPISDAQREYFESQTVVDYAISGTSIVLNLAGAVLLLLMRRPALYCFGITFVINVLTLTYQIIFKNWIATIGTTTAGMIGAIIGAFIGIFISLAIVLYVLYLYLTKALR